MQFTGNVVLHATKLSGDLAEAPVTLTPIARCRLSCGCSPPARNACRCDSPTSGPNQPYISTDTLTIGALHTGTPR
jgi:hypothetical protein